jgi:hypothetical protein
MLYYILSTESNVRASDGEEVGVRAHAYRHDTHTQNTVIDNIVL